MHKKIADEAPILAPQVRDWLIGGAAAGGAAGLATIIVKNIAESNRRAKAMAGLAGQRVVVEDTRDLDKEASSIGDGIMRTPMSIVGGAVAAGGVYHLVHKVYESFRQRRLAEEVQKARQQYLDSTVEEAQDPATKSASEGGREINLNTMETAVTSPLTLALISALGSGYLTHRYLSDNVKAPKPNIDESPRLTLSDSFRRRRQEQEAREAQALLAEKVEKDAPAGVGDVIKAAATGHLQALRDVADSKGMEAMFKYASFKSNVDVSEAHIKVAAAILVRDPLLSPGFNALCEAVLHEKSATYVEMAKYASEQDPEIGQHLETALVANNQLQRAMDPEVEKLLREHPELASELGRVLGDEQEGDETATADTNTSTDGKPNNKSVDKGDNKDMVDVALHGPSTAAPSDAALPQESKVQG